MRSEEVVSKAVIQSSVDLDSLSERELTKMAEAGQEVLEVHRILAKTGDNVVGELLRGNGTFYEWDHYPPGDVYDAETHAQYYYHAHPSVDRFEREHGHFHTFLRPKGMPKGIKPAEVPDAKMPEDPNDKLSHLIAIAMDASGFAFRLFTTNRWVTGEVWYDAEDVVRMLDRFEIDHARPSWPVNRWITAFVQLYKPQIAELLRARDRFVADWQAKHSGSDVYEDRELEVTSAMDVDMQQHLQAVGKALEKRTAA
jgi:hypothetical protein